MKRQPLIFWPFSRRCEPEVELPSVQYRRVVHEHLLQDEQLFDDVAQSFFRYQLPTFDLKQAREIQTDVLARMPKGTQTQLRHLDLGEWSVYWSFGELSLEFFVGQYGIFYAHVDRFGQEHRLEFKEHEQLEPKAS